MPSHTEVETTAVGLAPDVWGRASRALLFGAIYKYARRGEL